MKKMKRLLTMTLALCVMLSLAATPALAGESEYVVDMSVSLALGDNNLTLDPSVVTTIYEFEPDEAGVYEFTANSTQALVGYWGAGSFFVSDQTENKTNTLTYTLNNAGPSIMVGIAGVSSCVLTITRVGDEGVVTEPEWTQYKNKVEPKAYTLPDTKLVEVDVYDKEIDTAVLGEDGYYHLGSANGPVLIANLNHPTASLVAAMSYGQVRRYYLNNDGSVDKKVDFYDALNEYLSCADHSMYPVTEDIKTMFVELGESKGWYDKNILGNYLFSGFTVDINEAWMFACSYHDCVLSPFGDVNQNSWYHDALDYMVGKGYINGTSETTMQPGVALSRGMLVNILYKYAGSPSVSDESEPFNDVAEGKWYYNAVVWAYNQGVVQGTGENTFDPDGEITRQDLAVILYRAEGEPEVSGNLDAFSDADSVKAYGENAMIWAVNQGLIEGALNNDSVKLNPLGSATRAEAATILMRYLQSKEE